MQDGTRIKKTAGTRRGGRKRSDGRERNKERRKIWRTRNRKKRKGQNKRSERRQREVNNYVVRIRWPARSTLLPLLLASRTNSLPYLSRSVPFIPLRHCDDQRHSFPSGTPGSFIPAPRANEAVNFHAQHAHKRAVPIFSPSVPRNRYHRAHHMIQCV